MNYRKIILNKLPDSLFIDENDLIAKNIGILGYRYKDNTEYYDIEPLYLRKSEAEQKVEKK